MKNKFQEKGQALVVIALAAVALFGLAALAIDGSMVFSDKRHAQNAADTAALAGALAYTRGDNDITIESKAIIRTTSNGYDDNGTSNEVTITTEPVAGGCPGNAPGKYIVVNIRSTVQTTFARVVGTKEIINRVFAKARGCGYIVANLFDGNAVVSLKPNTTPCAFDTGNSGAVHWTVKGSGILSNSCAYSKDNASVTLDPGECVTSVGSASNFTCMQPNQTSQALNYPEDALAKMPPNPCDGTPGDVGLQPTAGQTTFSNGVYCISNMDVLDKEDIILSNATLYVTDFVFDLKFAGSGGFYGTATQGGDFDDYYMVIAYNGDPCTGFTDKTSQLIEWRGNGSGSFTGTIFAPSACLDLRGNADQSAMNSQIIGYIVGSNGNAEVYINYNEEENHQTPYEPTVSLWE